MTRALVATLCALSIAGLSATATFADDTDTTKDANVSGESAATETAPKESKASKKSKKLKIADGSKGKDSKTAETKDSKDAPSTGDAKPAKESKVGSKASNPDVGVGGRLAGFTAGVVLGVPVAIVRRTGIEIAQGVKDLVGDTDKWYVIGPAGVLAVPYGGVSGGIGGVLYGVKNAWVGAGQEPFGKDSFSLGDNVD